MPALLDLERIEWPEVCGSSEQLTLLFEELFGNASAYGRAPFRMTLEGSGAEAIFGVLDHGSGIPLEHRERVLEPQQRLVPTRAHPGAGLGLSIAQRVVAMHGGKLWVAQGPEGGTHMRFTLPGMPGKSESSGTETL